jgi:transposase-like protein
MKYTESERQSKMAIARAYQGSGLTKVEYARRNGLTVNSLEHWHREAQRVRNQPLIETAFLEVQMSDEQQVQELRQHPVSSTDEATFAGARPQVEVELPFGVKLRFYGVEVER